MTVVAVSVDDVRAVQPDFSAWYEEAAERVVGKVAAAVGDRLLAREAVAEAFALAYERWPVVSRMRSPEGWLFTVAVNLTRRVWRQRALESRALARALPALLAGAVEEPAEYSDDVYRAVRRLTPRQRTAVRLRYWDDLPEHEVAARMGVATGTASALLSTARARLRGALGPISTGGR